MGMEINKGMPLRNVKLDINKSMKIGWIMLL